MALDASAVLGTPAVAGVQVSPLGTYKASIVKVRAGNVQLVEGALFWRRFLRKKLAAVPLATISRTQIAFAEIGKAGVMLGSLPLRITLTNGDEWMFEVPRLVRRKGKHLVAELASGRIGPFSSSDPSA